MSVSVLGVGFVVARFCAELHAVPLVRLRLPIHVKPIPAVRGLNTAVLGDNATGR